MADSEERRRALQLTKEEQKAVVKEAIQEWLDLQFMRFGKYSMGALLAACFGTLLYLYLTAHGFKGM